MVPERSVRVNNTAKKKRKRKLNFGLFWQMVAKKLLVDDKITARVKLICLLGNICKWPRSIY